MTMTRSSRPVVRAAEITPSAGTSHTAQMPLMLGWATSSGACRLLGVAGEVGSADALLGDDLDVRIVLGDRLLDGVVALLGDEEVGGVEDKSDIALAAERLGHQVRGGDAVAVIVGRDRADVVLAGDEALRHIVHEDELDARVGGRLVGGRGGDRVGRDRDDDVRLLGHARSRCRRPASPA